MVSAGELVGRLLPGGNVTPSNPIIVLLNPIEGLDDRDNTEMGSAGSAITFRSGSFDKSVALLAPGETIRFKNQDPDSRLIFGHEGNTVRERLFLPVKGSSAPVTLSANVSRIKWVDQGSGQVCWTYFTDALWRKTLSAPGEFRFAGTPDGQYEIMVSDLLFRNISRKIEIRDGRSTSVLSFQQTDNGLGWVD